MRVIFLDIDGVLNSAAYDRGKGELDGNIDSTRLPLLKRIAAEGDARIVLSSTWRYYWNSDPEKRGKVGEELDRIFREAELPIFDKTPEIEGRINTVRPDEIKAWLQAHPDVESFVIIDDIIFGWGDLQDRVVHTSYYMGHGLGFSHVFEALRILATPLQK
ncbi:MAG: hypothetical protein IJ386_06910 [Clostridia bacterium]|nr:hypothetical protein [Clostridia bacterium]